MKRSPKDDIPDQKPKWESPPEPLSDALSEPESAKRKRGEE